MKIIRNGIEYELTQKEVLSAYYEQEHKFDVEDITGELENVCEGESTEEAEAAEMLLADSGALDRIASAKRHNMDKWDMNWETATSEAVYEAIVEWQRERGKSDGA